MNTRSAKLKKYALNGLLLINISLISNISLAGTSTKTDAPKLHSHQNITDAAQHFIDSNIDKSQFSRVDIRMNQLDSRLKLSHCPLPLTSTLAPGSRFAGKTTVHLRCNSTSPWTVYISAQIKLYGKTIQTAKPLSKGHILRKGDLVAVEKDLGRIKYGYFTNIDNLIGKQLKRRLAQNKTIRANYVKEETLVKRGERVLIIAENTGYSVKMSGTAMGSGVKGDRIRVKNTSSKRIVEGTIKEAGIVSIN